ncbi:hypothetical protein [Thermogladius calderae]|uniref:hypothetical protein n=1 Tax=Thermogladius calderae TaxID=1200300 RepID=UPI00064E59C3|nr:hypothetical protein [Thermogladius calderae]
MALNISIRQEDVDCVKRLMSKPCELLKMIPIVSDCSVSGDTVRLAFSDEFFKAVGVYTALEKTETKIALSLDYLEEGEPRARLTELWLTLEGNTLSIDYKLEAGFRVRGQAQRNLETSLLALRGVIPVVCSRLGQPLEERRPAREERPPPPLPPPQPPRAVQQPPRPAKAEEVKQPPPQPAATFKYDLSDPRTRARLMRESRSFKILPGGVKVEQITSSELVKGTWLVVETYASGKRYVVVENGVVQGLFCDQDCSGEPLTVIAYEVAGS